MCRKNHMWALAVISFGLGLLIGLWIESGFVQGCIGVAFVGFGIFIFQKK